MSDLRFNTIAGTVLAAGLAALGLRTGAEVLMHPHVEKEPAIAVAVVGESTAAAAPVEEGPPDFGRLYADEAQLAEFVARGEKVHKLCTSCHAFEAGGANGTGPLLYGVFGRTAGTHAGFGYSEGMKGYGQPWSYDNLYAYLEAPGKYVSGTSMSFAGLKKQEDRLGIVAYLRSLSPSPAPLPAPLPEAAPVEEPAPAAEGAPAEAPAEATPASDAAAPAAPAEAPAPT